MIRRPPKSPLFPYPPLSRSFARVIVAHDVGPAAEGADRQAAADDLAERRQIGPDAEPLLRPAPPDPERDRKSTRLNSSHLVISYAVFCLKKKNIDYTPHTYH